MGIDTVIAKICHIPTEFRKHGDVSIMQLVKESGYIENRDSVSKEAILRYVAGNESIVSSWIMYSEDQRCTPSWYFTGDTVGHMASTGKSENEIHFDNPAEGCAFYIKMMMEQFVG